MIAMMPSMVLVLSAIATAVQGYAVTTSTYESNGDVCPVGYPPYQVSVIPHVIYYPVLVNQYFEDNTIIIINGGVDINITNAPTSLSTVVTATTTSTATVTETVTSTASATAGPPVVGIACVFDADCASGSCVAEVCA